MVAQLRNHSNSPTPWLDFGINTRTFNRIRLSITILFGLVLICKVTYPLADTLDFVDPFGTLNHVSEGPTKSMFNDRPEPCRKLANLPTPLTLLDAVEHALCHNPQTTRAWAQVKAQAAAVGSSMATYLPSMDIRSSVSLSRRESQYIEDPRYDTLARSWQGEMNLNLNWILFDFGLRAANLETARRLLNAANASQDDTLQTVFFNTAKAFYEAQAAQSLVHANSEIEQTAHKSFAAAAEKYQVGVGTLADKLQAETSLAQSISKRIQAEGELNFTLGNLAMLMSLSPQTKIQLTDITGDLVQNTQYLQSVELLMERARREHPKIIAAREQWQAAEAKIDATNAQGLPSLSIVGSEGIFSDSSTPINNQGASEQELETRRLGLQLNIPLFEGFGRTYKIRESQAQAELKASELASTEQQVALDVWKSYQTLRTEAENLNANQVLNKSAEQSFDVAQGRYQAGVGNILELLKAQSDLASAKQQRLLAITRWHPASIRLAMNLGHLEISSLPIQASR